MTSVTLYCSPPSIIQNRQTEQVYFGRTAFPVLFHYGFVVNEHYLLTKEPADAHNSLVEGAVSTIAFIQGAIVGTYIGSGSKVVETIVKSTAGGFATDMASSATQDVFVDAFTVRLSTYTSILCQYESNFKMAFSLKGTEVNTYELRIYPDYCEVWYSGSYSGFGSAIIPSEKAGEMTLFELKEALGGP